MPKEAQTRSVLGIIGGSGLYDLPEIRNAEWRAVFSPWGQPSDDLLFGKLGELDVVFLPRHGRHHRIPPIEINYRANIDALKRAGVTDLHLVLRLRLAEGGLRAGTLRHRRPVHRSHVRAAEDVLRDPAASRMCRSAIR